MTFKVLSSSYLMVDIFMIYTFLFLLAFLLSLTLTPLIRKLALKFKILDVPGLTSRKTHKKPTPLLGGLAIFLSFFILLFIFALFGDLPEGKTITLQQLIGVFAGGLFLMIGGFLDDKYNLKPYQQVVWPILAALAVILSGIAVQEITNPLGGLIVLTPIISDLFIFLWLMALMYTTKFLDGLDGLVSGITVIGSAVIFSLAIFTKFFQPEVGVITALLAGSFLGFLIFNFHPAKIFLGEGGSVFAGYMLGVLAVISGGKIATALLVLGVPLLDLIWVVFRRIFKEKKSPFMADKKHLHFRLLEAGFSHRKAVLFLYVLAAGFGFSTLFLQSFGKLLAISFLTLFMIGLIISLMAMYKKRDEKLTIPKGFA